MKLEPEHHLQNSSSDDSDSDSEDEDDGSTCAAAVEENVERVEELNDLPPDLSLLAPPRVRGFDLKTKEWCKSLAPMPGCRVRMVNCIVLQACLMSTTSRTLPGMRRRTRSLSYLAATRRRSLSSLSPSTEQTIRGSTTLCARRVYPPFFFSSSRVRYPR